MRRNTGNMRGEQYCANTNTKEVHDLDNEAPQCSIDAIISSGNDWPYSSLLSARISGYDNCTFCIGNSRR